MATLIFSFSIVNFALIYLAKRSYRNRFTVIIQFVIGALIIELAIFHAALNLIFMVMAIGDFTNWHFDTVLGFGLCAYNAFILWQIHNSAECVRTPLNSALVDQFGEHFIDKVNTERKELIKDQSSTSIWLKPFSLNRKMIETIENIAYGDDPQNTLTVYRPKETDAATPLPIMLQIHGGGWILSYSDKQALPLRNQLVEGGWIFIAINYRLSPNAKFPDHLIDCKKALLWIKNNIQKFGGDPNFVMVTGGSAGGHLASLCALTDNQHQNILQPGFEEVTLPSIRGCIPFYGVYDFTDLNHHRNKVPILPFLEKTVMPETLESNPELWNLASPIKQTQNQQQPFFIIHGKLDTLAFIEEAKAFFVSLQSNGKSTASFAELETTQHAFDLFNSPHAIISVYFTHIFCELIYSEFLQENAKEQT